MEVTALSKRPLSKRPCTTVPVVPWRWIQWHADSPVWRFLL